VLIDRSHRRWIVITVLLAVISCAAYVPYHLDGPLTGPRGSTWQGLVYGGVATALMLFAGLLGVRRKLRSVRGLGRAETWLKGHIWLGLLAYLLVFLHAGFRLGGALTVVLLLLFTIVVVSGIYGLVVQRLVPRMMTAQLPHETLHEQVPVYTGRLLEEATRLVIDVCGPLRPDAAVATLAVRGAGDAKAAAPARRAGRVQEPVEGSAPFRDFFNDEVEPYLISGRGRLGAATSRRTVFAHVKALSGPGTHEALALVEDLCEERRRVSEQVRLHGWLHGWLIVHYPLAMALIVLSIVHAVASLYY
jgi:hypothetical protein